MHFKLFGDVAAEGLKFIDAMRIIPESIDYHCKILHKYDIFNILFPVIHNKISLLNASSQTYVSLTSD